MGCAITRVQPGEQPLEVVCHLVVEAREVEGRLARSTLQQRVGRAVERVGKCVCDEEEEADIALPATYRREVVVCLGARPAQRSMQ